MLARTLEKEKREALTTDGVLIEFANFFARSALRPLAISSVQRIRNTRGWYVERLTGSLVQRGEARFQKDSDKHWSLTDCISMETMLDHGCREIATPDHHFLQAGFRTLMNL